ncbi:hypothetical protein [Streptomyces flaveolus]|uniref:hypothetical protein n=1 Tax=Streptomyces flaveolus TaxID=67297 RepID=UPI00166F9AF6|nr:hypothetical protein [Streptomyces flaveolus]GGQ98701.1 hypothetical protein GCM10010216_71470 [Streptomyces flaveolus]
MASALSAAGRLARRHDVTVELRHSPYGGVTAVVLLPHKLLEELWPETGRESAPQRAEESGPNHPVRHPAQPVPGPQNGATRGALPGAPPHARPSVTATAVLSDQAPAGHPPAEPDLTDGLPRRVRQASLAPQFQPSAPPATGALFDRMTPAARSIQRLSAPPPTPAASPC